MRPTRQVMAAALLAACFAGSASAAGEPPQPPDDQQAPIEHGPGMGFGGMHGMHGGMMRLHRLDLSEAQKDKLFAIHHAAAPELREHMKAIRKAHEGLAELARADRFDDAKAGALSRELGQAIAAEALLHARTEAQSLAVLTPEQRDQLRRHRTWGPQMRPGMPHPHAMPDAQAPQRQPE